MKKIYSILSLMFISLLFSGLLLAQEEELSPSGSTSGNSGSNPFLDRLFDTVGKAVNEKLQEEFDRWLGTYKGRIEQVRLLEQTPDSIMLEVSYRGIKRQDGVSIKGEVLRGGLLLPDFSSTIAAVQGRDGIARLTISRASDESSWSTGGGQATSETSDQIRLSLVREDHPDHPFGQLVYDFPKQWGETSVNEEEGEAIELGGEQEGGQGSAPGSGQWSTLPGKIPAGTILTPVDLSTAKTIKGTTKPGVQLARLPAQVTGSYDLSSHAGEAAWRSNAGDLHFPGRSGDRQGYALVRARTRIGNSTDPASRHGTAVEQVLVMHPALASRQHDGWIEGRFGPLVLKMDNPHFLTTIGFLNGAWQSNGARFRIYVQTDDNKRTLLYDRRLPRNQVVPVDVLLSRWKGKPVQLILHVSALGDSTQDYAAWVKPRIVGRH